MVLQYWIWIAVGISFSIYIAIAIISRASSTGEFYIAGKGVPPIANGMKAGRFSFVMAFPTKNQYQFNSCSMDWPHTTNFTQTSLCPS